MIAYYIVGLAGTLVYPFFMGQYESSLNAAAGEVISNYANEAMGRIGVSIGWTIVWIIYWCHSKRVEYTFR
jgi:hypothetical protein